MSDELADRRWRSKGDPTAHKPVDAVKAFLREVEAGNIKPTHICICYANEDADNGSGWFQAGKLDFHGALGLIQRVLYLMNEQ